MQKQHTEAMLNPTPICHKYAVQKSTAITQNNERKNSLP
jgi:hypothetical protein